MRAPLRDFNIKVVYDLAISRKENNADVLPGNFTITEKRDMLIQVVTSDPSLMPSHKPSPSPLTSKPSVYTPCPTPWCNVIQLYDPVIFCER